MSMQAKNSDKSLTGWFKEIKSKDERGMTLGRNKMKNPNTHQMKVNGKL